jgi:hypothetical protein
VNAWHPRQGRRYSSSIMRDKALLRIIPILFALLVPTSALAGAHTPKGPEDFRFGISFGGISFIGLILEHRWGNRAIDLTVGSWSFRDLSVSVVGKQYFGPGDFRPFSGLGLWMVFAPHHGPGERGGISLVARAPVGVDWNLDGDSYLGASISLNRALWIRRKDPADDTPPSDRLIPLPGFYYRWKR